MNVLERLKIELTHKDYFIDYKYTMYLTATDTYNKQPSYCKRITHEQGYYK